MKATIQLDPSLDVVANRVPNVFIQRRQMGEKIYVEQIERLARGLDQASALVISPEGGNWTPGRWRRAIGRLEQLGRRDLAARAREMPNLLPPLPRGRRDLRSPCRAGPAGHRRRRLAEPADGPDHPREVVAGTGRRGAANS